MQKLFGIKDLKTLIEGKMNSSNLLTEVKEELTKILRQSLSSTNNQWTFAQFLTLVSGFLYEDILRNRAILYIGHQNDLQKLRAVTNHKPTNRLEALEDTINYYHSELTKIGSKKINGQKIKANTLKTPSDWLRLVEENQGRDEVCNCYFLPNESEEEVNFFQHYRGIFVHEVIKKLIIYNYLGLEEKLAESGLDRGAPLDKDHAALYLTKELGKNISPQQVLDLARQHNTFNAYVLAGKFQISSKYNIPSMRLIDAAIGEGWLTMENKYHFNGLVSLLKDDDSCSHKEHKHTIEHLSQGNKIQVRREVPWFYHRISLSEYATHGDTTLRIKSGETEITADDLLFVESELIDFIAQHKEKAAKKDYNISATSTQDELVEPLQYADTGESIEQKSKIKLPIQDRLLFQEVDAKRYAIFYGKEKAIVDKQKGFIYIETLVSIPNKEWEVDELYYKHNPRPAIEDSNLEHMEADIQTNDLDSYDANHHSDTIDYDDNDGLSVVNSTKGESQSPREIKKYIAMLKEQLESIQLKYKNAIDASKKNMGNYFLDQNQALTEEIKKQENNLYRAERTSNDPVKENIRKNVSARIKEAIQTLLPYKEIYSHLDRSIKTGNKCRYILENS